MAETQTLHDAFLDELKDAYDAEKQLTKALPKLAKASTSPELRQACEDQLEETNGHVEKLEQVFQGLDEKAKGKHCDGIAGIIDEGKNVMGEDFEGATMDAVIIASAHAIVAGNSGVTGGVVNGKLLNGSTTVEKVLRPGKPA